MIKNVLLMVALFFCCNSMAMKINVKTLTGKTVEFEASGSNTVRHLKDAIWKRFGTLEYRQLLVFGSKELQNGHTLAECGISEGSIIFLVVRLLGGAGDAAIAPPEPFDKSPLAMAALLLFLPIAVSG